MNMVYNSSHKAVLNQVKNHDKVETLSSTDIMFCLFYDHVYKISTILRALWLAEMCVYMKVYEHSCDVAVVRSILVLL